MLLAQDQSIFQDISVSPPNEAISVHFRPTHLKPDLWEPSTVAKISYNGKVTFFILRIIPLNIVYVLYPTVCVCVCNIVSLTYVPKLKW